MAGQRPRIGKYDRARCSAGNEQTRIGGEPAGARYELLPGVSLERAFRKQSLPYSRCRYGSGETYWLYRKSLFTRGSRMLWRSSHPCCRNAEDDLPLIPPLRKKTRSLRCSTSVQALNVFAPDVYRPFSSPAQDQNNFLIPARE